MKDYSKIKLKKPSIVLMLIPLLLTGSALVYGWIKILTEPFTAKLQHYLALVSFLIVLALFIKSRIAGTLAFGIYLIVAITTIFSLTYNISYSGIGIGPLKIPIGNLLSWGIFIVYLCLNLVSLFDYYLAYKVKKGTL